MIADPSECSLQFDPIGGAHFISSCDVVKTALATARVPYSNDAITAFDGSTLPTAEFEAREAFKQELSALLKTSGYPTAASL